MFFLVQSSKISCSSIGGVAALFLRITTRTQAKDCPQESAEPNQTSPLEDVLRAITTMMRMILYSIQYASSTSSSHELKQHCGNIVHRHHQNALAIGAVSLPLFAHDAVRQYTAPYDTFGRATASHPNFAHIYSGTNRYTVR